VAVAVVVAAGSLAGCSRVEPLDDGRARIERPVDGDTVVVDLGGRRETVRLLGIDTPETVDPDRPTECFGPESSARLAELLPPGTAVRLERDAEARDRYGRLLAYLHRADDDLFVNLTLVEEGYAEVLIIEPNGAYRSALRTAETAAREGGAGLWSACSHE
jgi:micrococcal nuclease